MLQKNNPHFWMLLLSYIALSACVKSLSPVQFNREVGADEDFFRTDSCSSFKLYMRYLPPALVAFRELKPLETVSEGAFTEALGNYKNQLTFQVKVATRNNENLLTSLAPNVDDYNVLNRYFAYEFGQNFYILAGSDTIRASACTYQNSFGMTPDANFLVVFPNIIGQKNISVCYTDVLFSCNTPIKFEFEQSTLNKPLQELKWPQFN